MQLKDKTFIVTGATGGMGKAISLCFAKEGASIIANGRDQKKGAQLLKELKVIHPKVAFYAGDVGQSETNQLLVNQSIEKFGRLDGIMVNAGVLGLGKVTEVSENEWLSTFDTNLHSFFYLSKYGIPHLQLRGGVIIANASIAAFKTFPNHPAYCATKAALVALVKQMALDYGPNIRINAICPGPVDTPLIWNSAQAFPEPERAVQQVAEKTLLNRLGTPEDIADLSLFLASQKSSWITGTTITIDGGIMAS